jgi:hypothetical protein
MKKLLVIISILSAIAFNANAAKHTKGDVSKADYIKQAEARFDKMDANKDGILTAAEKKAYFDKIKADREAAKKKTAK